MPSKAMMPPKAMMLGKMGNFPNHRGYELCSMQAQPHETIIALANIAAFHSYRQVKFIFNPFKPKLDIIPWGKGVLKVSQ
jgi:hypothetical protein